MGADAPANGENVNAERRPAVPARPALRRARSTPTGNADCEAGQRGYLERNAAGFYADSNVQDRPATPRTPGDQGPTYDRPRARARRRDVHARSPRPAPYTAMPASASGER